MEKTEKVTEGYEKIHTREDLEKILNKQGSNIGISGVGHSCGSNVNMREYSQHLDYGIAIVDTYSWESGLCGGEDRTNEQIFMTHIPTEKTNEVQRIEYEGKPENVMHVKNVQQYPKQTFVKYTIGKGEFQVRYNLPAGKGMEIEKTQKD